MKRVVSLFFCAALAGSALFSFISWNLRESGKIRLLASGGDSVTSYRRLSVVDMVHSTHYYDRKTVKYVIVWALVGGVFGVSSLVFLGILRGKKIGDF
jgi:hypothetical protein